MGTRLEPGALAPDFTLSDQDGRPVSLEEFRGRKVVIYFYPADLTPGCTTEACQFSENLQQFRAADVPVLGVSPDDAASHQKFREAHSLAFPLLTDAEHKVMEAYGAWGEKKLYGRASIGVIRSTFLVDETGHILRAWYNVRANGHAEKVLAALC